MRRILLLPLLVACATPPPAPPSPTSDLPTATVLFERHLRAIGGSFALTQKKRATIRFKVAYPNRGVAGTGTFALADGRGVLTMDLEGVGRIEKTFESAERWATDLHLEANLAKHYANAKTKGRTTLDGLPVFEVEATGRDGPVTLTFDASVGVLVAKAGEVKTPDGAVKGSVRYADYQDFGGLRCARLVTQRTGDRIQQIEIESVDME